MTEPTADQLERAVARLTARAKTGRALDASDEAALGALVEAGPRPAGVSRDPEPVLLALLALLGDASHAQPPLALFEALAVHGGAASLEPLRQLTGFFAGERARQWASATIGIVEERLSASAGGLAFASRETGALSRADRGGALALSGDEDE